MIQRIQNTGKATMVAAEFRYFSESTALFKEGKNQEFSIQTSILEFYKEMDFAEIAWYVKVEALDNYLDKELDIPGGFANIPPFEKLLKGLQNKDRNLLIAPSSFSSAKRDHMQNCFVPFDYLEGDGAICFLLTNNQLNDNLYLVRPGPDNLIESLETGCRDYFLTGCRYHFFNDWQQAIYLDNKSKRQTMDFYLGELKLKTI
jgi:hypothetical protein